MKKRALMVVGVHTKLEVVRQTSVEVYIVYLFLF